MTIQSTITLAPAIIPETAPFTSQQRVWLNAFFAGYLPSIIPSAAGDATLADEAANDMPWHDAAMPLDERMKLADGRPVERRLFAAIAQQDCGQCGYVCETYALALHKGDEARQNLCVPGGKETARMLKQLLLDGGGGGATKTGSAQATPSKTQADKQRGYDRDAPVIAIFGKATRLNAPASQKDTRHIVLDIAASGIDYVPGDSIGLYPRNDPAHVDQLLNAIRAPGDFPIAAKTLRQALIEDYALSPAPDMLFELISYLVGGERRKKAKALAKGEDPDGDAATLDVFGVFEKFSGVHPDPEALLETLEPLQPRLYSISSSPLASPGQVHLTVDSVRYKIGDRQRAGVASVFLADRLENGASVSCYIQKAHAFSLPPDPSTPIIMVGPGTGVAPFRSFLHHRRAVRAPGKTWLFFGHQQEANDFFYREEWQQMLAEGALTTLSTAWSRDGARKVYVQDKMLEAGPELWRWFKAGAHFYVCGDAKRMAKDVEAAVVDIAAKAGQMSEAGARDFLAELKAAGRYQADVY